MLMVHKHKGPITYNVRLGPRPDIQLFFTFSDPITVLSTQSNFQRAAKNVFLIEYGNQHVE